MAFRVKLHLIYMHEDDGSVIRGDETRTGARQDPETPLATSRLPAMNRFDGFQRLFSLTRCAVFRNKKITFLLKSRPVSRLIANLGLVDKAAQSLCVIIKSLSNNDNSL